MPEQEVRVCKLCKRKFVTLDGDPNYVCSDCFSKE